VGASDAPWGTNPGSTVAIPNDAGIYIHAVSGAVVGTSATADRNVISGNAGNPIYVDVDTTNVTIENNYLGTTASGKSALRNGYGVTIKGKDHQILRNVITADGNGISVNGAANCLVNGNIIGIGADGKTLLGGKNSGIYLSNKATGNVISGNAIGGVSSSGIVIDNAGTDKNSVVGNLIGLGPDGLTPCPIVGSGIDILGGAKSNVIGTAGKGNVIGRCRRGIGIWDAGTQKNVVQYNIIGLDATGKIGRGNSGDGVAIANGASSNTIGGVQAGNLISANGSAEFGYSYGIALWGTGTANNEILGNTLGLDITGTNLLPNFNGGIVLDNGPKDNLIGGIKKGEGNILRGHVLGVSLRGAETTGNRIRGNSIGGSSRLGIDLSWNNQSFNVTPNDNGDVDTGPNRLQNFPFFSSATRANGKATVKGSLNSTPSKTFLIDVYLSNTPHESGYGEGEIWLGVVTVTTDASGNATFSGSFACSTGGWITATATNSSTGDTSEFSKGIGMR